VKNNDKVTWKFHLRRDDNEPAPWTSSGVVFTREMSVGFIEVYFVCALEVNYFTNCKSIRD
jgi:hypothetical protein